MMMSAPSRMATPIGMGSERNPSTYVRPPIFHGRKMYGIAMEARIASTRLPVEKMTCSPLKKSVAVR